MMKRVFLLCTFLLSGLTLAASGCDASGVGADDCVDPDGDGYGEGSECLGADCTEDDSYCWDGPCCPAADCRDEDGDGYGEGADCLGPDCNDEDESCQEGRCCGDCLDADGDGFGEGRACEAPDCDDENPECWQDGDDCCPGGFVACWDQDGDGYGLGWDCVGSDCDDDDASCFEGPCCPPECDDLDEDGWGVGADCSGPDCNDFDYNCHEGACCPADASGIAGDACFGDNQCLGVSNGSPSCIFDLFGLITMPGGYCTSTGCTPGDPCDASGGMCVGAVGFGVCLMPCTVDGECRIISGYTCQSLPFIGGDTYCLPQLPSIPGLP